VLKKDDNGQLYFIFRIAVLNHHTFGGAKLAQSKTVAVG